MTKKQADNAVLNSIFTPGGTLACKTKTRFDMGKYQKTIIGKEAPERYADLIIWAERKQDKHGSYYALFCLD